NLNIGEAAEVLLPINNLTIGSLSQPVTIKAWVDNAESGWIGFIRESNENNNTLIKTITIIGTTDTNCQVTLDGIIYKLSPCEIKTSMIDGDGGKTVTFKIDQVVEGRSYNFETYGYNEGFQTNGFIPSTGSGGASGDVNIEATFRDDVLNADGKNTKKYSGYLPIKIYHGSYGMGVEKTLKLMIELDVLPKAPSTDTNCQITLDNTVYQLSPCEINTSMTDGAGDKEFSFKLDQVSSDRSYGFGVSGYGEGFPTNGIITTPFSGGASGDVNFKAVLKDQYLNAENGQTKKYNGYLPIKVSYSSFGIEKTLKLMVNVDVSPAATLDPTPRISYWPGKVNQHTENGVWKTDPDGTSGSTINMLTYCKKWYPNTVRYEYYKDETITDWKRVYNTGSYTSTKPVYKCILDATTEQHDFIVQNIQAYFLPQVGNYMTLYIKFDDLFAPNDNLIDYEFKIDAPGAVIGTSIMQPNNNAEIWRTIMYNTPGMHRLTVTVDPNNKINEVNENNNSKSYSIEIVGDPTSAKPDLKITDIFLENNLLKAKYCNIGTTAISPSYFYIKMTANSKVHTGTSNNSNYPFSVPASDFCGTTDGYPTSYFGLMNGQSYLVDANIDWDNRVAESNEYNNGFSKNITMGGATTTASLTLTKNQAYGNQNFTKPTTQAKVASFVVSAGANSGVNIDTINISQATSGTMQNMKLMTGSTQIGATKVTLASNNTTENVFTAYNLNLAAGESKVIDVYADIKAGSGTNSFALVVDLQGTATSGVSVTTGDVTMQAMTLAAGSITSSDGGKPASAIIVAGTTVKMNAIKFTASGEPFTITKVRILEDNPSNYDSINKVILEYKDKSGNTVTKEGYLNSGGIVDFTGLNMYVPKDSTAILTVKAEIPTISAGADSGDQPRLIFDGDNNFSALGESSNMVNTFAGNDVYGNNMTVRKTVPTFMTQSLPTSVLNNGTATLYKFTVAADAAGDVAWKKISFKLETGGNVGIAGTYLYEETNPSLILGNGTIGNESIIEFALLAPETITAGRMRTYIVKGTVTNADGGMVKLTSLGDYGQFMWSDLSTTPVSLSFGPWVDGALVKTFGGSSVLYNSNYVPSANKPDLTVEDIEYARNFGGLDYVLRAKVCNRGMISKSSNPQISTEFTVNGKTAINGSTEPIEAGQCIYPLVLISSFEGLATSSVYSNVKVEVDRNSLSPTYNNVVDESNEGNNVLTKTVTIIDDTNPIITDVKVDIVSSNSVVFNWYLNRSSSNCDVLYSTSSDLKDFSSTQMAAQNRPSDRPTFYYYWTNNISGFQANVNYFYKVVCTANNTTVESKIYSFNIKTNESSLLGDLDGNGQVQMYDAALLARYLAKQSTLTTAQLTVAEVTSNSVLDNTDVEVISDYAMGKVDKLPVRFGDVDGNGLAETYDAALVLGHVKGTSVAALNLYQKYVADVNRDGLVTEDDTALIGQAAIGLITLPAPKADPNFAKRLAGRLLLATEDRGRIFYIYPVNYKKYEVTFDNMMSVLPSLAAGITNNDLNKIPINLESVSSDVDSDDDGFSDYSEVKYGYNPFVASNPANRGNDKLSFDRTMAYQNRGRFLLQVEDRGRLWYVDFSGQRWEITWANAMSVFPKLSLGITNADLAKIPSGN
ncbi:hypothetical protein GYA54_02805, partial [Candidatus Kuenenbacteria bacterium]|nr:hypothetical protein [Candidatus Kuenenbacteria bacterium]